MIGCAMRVGLLCLALIGFAAEANAAEPAPPILRGSEPASSEPPFLRGAEVYVPGAPVSPRWSGWYGGVQFGYGVGHADFNNATQSSIANMARGLAVESEFAISSLPQLGVANTGNTVYGLFAGYNFQWDEVILGLEMNYNHTGLSAQASDVIARQGVLSNGTTAIFTLISSASVNLTDYATFRARAGYASSGVFLPYGFVGAAVGLVDVTRSATLILHEINLSRIPPLDVTTTPSASESKRMTIYGFSAGLGVDVMLRSNIFLRGEYEFTQFSTFSDITMNINTVRLAAGLRF